MPYFVDPFQHVGSFVPYTLCGVARDGLAVRSALPTVNPGDDDEDDDEDEGNIEPDEDEGVDDDGEDDEDEPLWARARRSSGTRGARALLRRNNSLIRRESHRRHTARPACPVTS